MTADAVATHFQSVVFNLGGEAFALPVGIVREILDHCQAFQCPGVPNGARA